ncbi:ComEC family protein [Superficieibacter electus]|uniref:ComEC family protein n=1 Tax=Superficieibacter electus TaxID=2022662 RepID=A0A2P5GRK4_9ENTR|nr:ComEC family protein [Superficieibacter electus]POP49190.1 ComEC family protein [Superficieibacter electus]
MRLPQLAICVIAGIAALIWLPELPGVRCTSIVVIFATMLTVCRSVHLRMMGFKGLFFCWGVLAAQQVIWPAAHLTGKNQRLEIALTATDGATTHQGVITHVEGKRLFPAPGITLYGNYLPQAACAGQRWAMVVRARAVHGELNDGGFDTQRNAFAQHNPLTGRFMTATALDTRCSMRARFLASLQATLADYPWQGVMLGLGLGERLAVPADIKKLMQQTGTSHLMAISGLHIALGASLGWLLVRAIQFFLPCRLISWRAPLAGAFICAALYAWLTGLQPPALRTVVALGMWYGLRLTGRQWSAWDIWLCCIAAMLFCDPLAVLSQSLWLSAFAVAALIFWYQWMPLPEWKIRAPLRQLVELIYLQLGLMLLLLPLQVLLFHGVSTTSLLANLFAVPLVTFVVVPLILAGMLLHLTGLAVVEQGLWFLADRLLALLFYLLRQLPDGWLNVDERWQSIVLIPWLMLVLWRFRAWWAMKAVTLTLLIVMTFPLWREERKDTWAVHMLDVGQGLGMVIERHGKAILYDTGLAWPGGDSGQQLIIPWLRWHHLRPEGIIISHEHLDHRGGLVSIHQQWPSAWIRSPLGWAGHLPCFRGERWQWEGLTFSVHWPLKNNRTQGNNRSCVIKVDDGQYSILLTGDIEMPAELSMLSHYWQHLASTIIQVPHHGSNTSSGIAFIQRVNGQAALASASRYNAWHFPSAKVVKRYQQEGYQWVDTPHQGQISVIFSHSGWQINGLREQILPRWYHQWFGVPADNG